MHRYEIINEGGRAEGIDLLSPIYGALWESTLNRLSHDCDGWLLNPFSERPPLLHLPSPSVLTALQKASSRS